MQSVFCLTIALLVAQQPEVIPLAKPATPPRITEPSVTMADITWSMTFSREAIGDQWNAAFNHKWYCHRQLRVCLPEHERFWRAAISDAEWRERVWEHVRFINSTAFGVDSQLSSLVKLREYIGYEAYYSGQIPSPVPSWALTNNYRDVKPYESPTKENQAGR